MKKIKLLTLLALTQCVVLGQVYKTINTTSPGILSTLLTTAEKNTVTNLTITGIVDARDFKYIRDNLSSLKSLDMSSTTIKEYIGNNGTSFLSTTPTLYPADEIPSYFIYNYDSGIVNSNLTEITLPSNIKTIGDYAFMFFTGSQINLPNGIIKIGNSAFGANINLNIPDFPNTLTEIGDNAFEGCVNFNGKLEFNEGLITIGNRAFADCEYITDLKLPSTLNIINSKAFYRCINISGIINLPDQLTIIGSEIFSYCNKVYGFYINESNSYFSTIDGVLFDKIQTKIIQFPTGITGTYVIPTTVEIIGSYSFSTCQLSDISFPEDLKNIESYAFLSCKNLISLTLNKNLLSIGNYVFTYCTNLKSITCLNTTPPTLGYGFLNGVQYVYVYQTFVNVYRNSDGWKNYNISAITTTNNNVEITPRIQINTTSSGIIVKGIMSGEVINIYNTTGILIKQFISNANSKFIPLNGGSIYIIQTYGNSVKVLVN